MWYKIYSRTDMCSYARSRLIKGVNKLGFLLPLAFYDLKARGEKKRRRQYAHSSVELRGAIINVVRFPNFQ